jgi:hypothetical protein
MGHIEAIEWLDAGKLIVRDDANVQVVDFDTKPRKNWTLYDAELFVRF